MKIGLADPDGAALYNWYAHGELKAEGSSITEGIGQGRVTANLEGLTVDLPYNIPDAEALPIVLRPAARGGALHGRLDRHQRRRRDAHGARPRAGPDHRHHPLRLRHALPVEAVQPGVPARRRACRSRPGSRAGAPTSPMCGRAERRRAVRAAAAACLRAPLAPSCSPGAARGAGGAGAGAGRRRRPPRRDLGGRSRATPRRGSPTRRPDRRRSRRCASGWCGCAPRRRRPSARPRRTSTSSTAGWRRSGRRRPRAPRRRPRSPRGAGISAPSSPTAQAPVLEAQEAYQRANALIEAIDRVVRGALLGRAAKPGPEPAAAAQLGGRGSTSSAGRPTRCRDRCGTRSTIRRRSAGPLLQPAAAQPAARGRGHRRSPSCCAAG